MPTITRPSMTSIQPTRATVRRRSRLSAMAAAARTIPPMIPTKATVSMMSSSSQMWSWSARRVTSARLRPSPAPLGLAVLLADRCSRLAETSANESERSSPPAPPRPSTSDSWVWRMAVRKIERNVSVSTTASTARIAAGRKAMACSFPARASCSVRRSATSRRTDEESRSCTVRRLNVALS